MTHPEDTSLRDDLDLRKHLQRIFNSWRFLVPVMFVAALVTAGVELFLPPVYTASAVVVVPAYATNGIDPTDYLKSEDIRDAVLAKPGIRADIVSRLNIAADRQSESIFRITVTDSDPDRAALGANTWAEEGIKWVKQKLLSADRSWLNKTEDDLTEADRKLLLFLESNGLNVYSIIDLRIYEGMYSAGDFTPASAEEPLVLRLSVRRQLRSLLRAQSNASQTYNDAQERYRQHQLMLQTNSPTILINATPASAPVRPRILSVLRDAGLAAVLGLLAGVILVLAWDWWKKPAGKEAR
jgi:hypothetical protein